LTRSYALLSRFFLSQFCASLRVRHGADYSICVSPNQTFEYANRVS
jgi:hypothetical protein